MSPIMDQVKPETADALATQAKEHGLSVDEYLKTLLGVASRENPDSAPTLAEFEADMEALADGTKHLPDEPISYTRKDIYFNHD
jgi:hypothetical protein